MQKLLDAIDAKMQEVGEEVRDKEELLDILEELKHALAVAEHVGFVFPQDNAKIVEMLEGKWQEARVLAKASAGKPAHVTEGNWGYANGIKTAIDAIKNMPG